MLGGAEDSPGIILICPRGVTTVDIPRNLCQARQLG